LLTTTHPEAKAAGIRYRRILLPVDGTALGEVAVPYAAELARLSGAELTLLRVYEMPALPEPAPAAMVGAYSGAQERATARGRNLRHAVERYLDGVAEQLREQGIAVELATFDCEPGDAIVREAEGRQVDLIVMATHGRTGLARRMTGSVAEYVLHHTARPVLLVHGEG
jgi:nucleotide-binding universal stress UspA family protein